jgi:hypothetical protein
MTWPSEPPRGCRHPAAIEAGLDERRSSQRRGRRQPYRIDLGVDDMILDPLGPYRLEGAIADVEGDISALDAARAQRFELFCREVQPRRWCGNGSRLTCVHGLIAIAIRGEIVPLDVGRQWNMPDAIDRGIH